MDTLQTKIAEKKLDQLQDDLAYAKQKRALLADGPPPGFGPIGGASQGGENGTGNGLSEGRADNGDGTTNITDNNNPNNNGPADSNSEVDKAKYQAKKMRALKKASVRKLIEELGDQLKMAKLVKDVEEERQVLEDQEIRLEVLDIVNSVADKLKKLPIDKIQENHRQQATRATERKKMKDNLQRLQDLKRSYDIDLDSSSPPRTMSISAWPNDEAVKVDTFQLHFTDDHFSLRCCNIQLTRASIRPRPFNRGTTNLSHWIKLASEPKVIRVAKCSILPTSGDQEKENCMQRITSQLYASNTAKAFSEKRTAKSISYATVQLLCFYQRSPQVYMTLEPAIEGVWKRYDNNSILIDVEKNSYIHAFSHFSYESSQHQMLIANAQGTKTQDKYLFTDPTVHCVLDDDSFGSGNLGQDGIDDFFRSHVCNKVCQSLGLAKHPFQPKSTS